MTDTGPPFRDSLLYRRADGSLREYYCERKADTYTVGYCPRYMSRPRNVDRPYRNSNDEPAKAVVYVRALRQSLCGDGHDRTRCSRCAKPVYTQPPPAERACRTGQRGDEAPLYRSVMMSPERVFRDVVNNSVSECLQPVVRNALLDAFNQSMRKGHQPQQTHKHKQAEADADPFSDSRVPAKTFPYFSYLPFEIRCMIWDLAMPSSRVLLRTDLDRRGYQTELQRRCSPDLYDTCVDARSVAEAHARCKVLPGYQTAGVSSDARLLAGLDVLYYPWLGTNYIDATGGSRYLCSRYVITDDGTGKSRRGQTGAGPYGTWPTQLRKLGLPVPTIALDSGWIDKNHKETLMWIAGLDDDDDDDDDDEEEAEEEEAGRDGSESDASVVDSESISDSASRASSWRRRPSDGGRSSTATSISTASSCSSPAHSSTLLSSSSSSPSAFAMPLSVAASSAALTHLQVVVADILVPVQIRVDRCTPAQRGVFQVHDGHEQRPSLRGMDFTVLADLYDDWRIEELLSLRTATGCGTGKVPAFFASMSNSSSKNTHEARHGYGSHHGLQTTCLLNKSAGHWCLGCTRSAWEAREWHKFGPNLGRRLQSLCRPMVLFSIILEFVGGPEEGY